MAGTERELLETFEAAKKAADAAGPEGSPEEERCVDALSRLRAIPVKTADLVATQVGKHLRPLTKHPNSQIQSVASDLLAYWKQVVLNETSNSKKNAKAEDEKPVKAEKVGNAPSPKVGKAPKPTSSSVKGKEECDVEPSSTKVVNLPPKAEKIGDSSPLKKPVSVPAGMPKLTSLVKCNDPTRDKFRELLADAFSRVADETSKDDREEIRNLSDEVKACDPFRVAVIVESAMFEKLGRSTGSHKQKYRSIMFNLKAENNTDFRRRVLIGEVKPEGIVDLSAEDMASDARRLENRQIQEKALFECERAGAPKATTDQFKCGRCGQRKTTYYQLQTRSADEPMTTFVTCVNCNNHWKFC